MGLLEMIIAQLPSKKFGDDTTVYFDKKGENVLLIVQKGARTYLVESDEDDDKTYTLKSELMPGLSVDCEIEPKKFWFIPNIDEMDMSKRIGFFNIKSDAAHLMCNKLFEVVSYTLLETPEFKGSLFSNSTINIIVTNSQGEAYAVPFLVGEGVRGCDGNPSGNVLGEAYRMETLGRVVNGNLIVEL